MTAGGKPTYNIEVMDNDIKFQFLMAKTCGQPGTAMHQGNEYFGFAYRGSFFFVVPDPQVSPTDPAKTVWRAPP